MLDQLFALMNGDGYSKWTIHSRFRTFHGDVAASIPHEEADGRKILRELIPSLAAIANSVEGIAQESAPVEQIPALSGRSRFQSYLNFLLTGPYRDAKSIVIAVDLSALNLEPLRLQNNKVTFPTFAATELLQLVQAPLNEWRQVLEQRALAQIADYAEAAKLVHLSARRRMPYYDKFPVNSADLVVSYWGKLDDYFPDFSKAKLSALDCAVSVSHGPKCVHVCYGKGEIIESLSTRPQATPFSWDQPVRAKIGVAR